MAAGGGNLPQPVPPALCYAGPHFKQSSLWPPVKQDGLCPGPPWSIHVGLPDSISAGGPALEPSRMRWPTMSSPVTLRGGSGGLEMGGEMGQRGNPLLPSDWVPPPTPPCKELLSWLQVDCPERQKLGCLLCHPPLPLTPPHSLPSVLSFSSSLSLPF